MHVIELIVAVLLVWLILFWLRGLVTKVTVYEFERGLKYVNGRHARVLNPGQYWIYNPTTTVTKVDVRPRVLTVPGQEVLSSDSISLKVSAAIQYEIVDANLAINRSGSYYELLYLIVQVAVRDLIGSQKIDELLEKRSSFNEQLLAQTSARALELGIKLSSVVIKDIMFPGELKKVFAQVVKAQKEGLAALERARGESAALRNLANAAKVLENNPNLMQLRILQTLSESSGNTLVLGMPPQGMPIPVHKKGPSFADPDRTHANESPND